MKTKNIDVSMLCNHLLLFRNEVYQSASGGTFNVSEHDLVRYESYLARAKADLAHVKSLPSGDFPKWHPVEIEMPETPKDYNLDSPSVVYILRYLDASYFELLSSQSSDKATSLEIADAKRYEDVLERLTAWIANLRGTQEVDLPEMANSNA